MSGSPGGSVPTGCCDICGQKFTANGQIFRCTPTGLHYGQCCVEAVRAASLLLHFAVNSPHNLGIRHPEPREFSILAN